MSMVTSAGQEVKHWVEYEKYPETQDKHDVLVVQVEQGDTQFTHTIGIWVVSGYIYGTHSERQVLVVVVLFKYLKAVLVLQVAQ